MNLCDSNVWLAMALSTHVHQAAARRWLDAVAGRSSVLFCPATQQTFLRLLTTAAVLAPYGNEPLSNREAWAVYQSLLADDRIALRTDEPAGLQGRWGDFAVRESASPKLWMDAYLASFAVATGATLVTTDVGFRQFAGLDLVVLGS